MLTEENEPANPIIARARERGWNSPVHAARLLRCIDDKNPRMSGHIEVDWNDFVAATPEQIEHARHALTRIADSGLALPSGDHYTHRGS